MVNILNVIDKALMESYKGINVTNSVNEYYGEDFSIFEDSYSSAADNNKERFGSDYVG